MRYTKSDDEQYLEMSILQSTHAILYFPSRETSFQPFFSSGPCLSRTQIKFGIKAARDATCCLKYLYYMRNPSFERLGVIENKVTKSLGLILALQMELEPGNSLQYLEETAVLLREQLSSDLFRPELNDTVDAFSIAFDTYFADFLNPPSQQIIEYLYEANARLPDSSHISFALSQSFLLRFILTLSNEDYERAMAPLDRIITSHSPAESPNKDLTRALTTAAQLTHIRFMLYETPEYLEEAISRTRAHLISTSLEDPEYSDTIQLLEELKRTRLDDFGVIHTIPKASPGDSENICLPPFSHLTASLAEMNAMGSRSMTTRDWSKHIHTVNSMVRITNRTNIDDAIDYCRVLLASLQQRLVLSITMTDFIINKLGNFLYRDFTLTSDPEYLDESIDVHRGILKTSHSQWTKFEVIRRLLQSLAPRFRLSEDREDLDEVMQLFPIAVTNAYVKITKDLGSHSNGHISHDVFGTPVKVLRP